MTVGPFPTTRLRRNRTDGWTRRLVAETRLSVDDLIWPVFVCPGAGKMDEVPSVPMMMRHRPPGSLALRVLKDDLAHAHDPDPDRR